MEGNDTLKWNSKLTGSQCKEVTICVICDRLLDRVRSPAAAHWMVCRFFNKDLVQTFLVPRR